MPCHDFTSDFKSSDIFVWWHLTWLGGGLLHGADRWYLGWYQHCAERGPWRPVAAPPVTLNYVCVMSASVRVTPRIYPQLRTMEIEIAWIYYNQTDQRSQHRVRTSWDRDGGETFRNIKYLKTAFSFEIIVQKLLNILTQMFLKT